MAETLLEQQTLSDFALNEAFGAYAKATRATFNFIVGETYTVVWDDKEYKVVAQDTSALIPNTTAVGNGSAFGLAGNNEPFAIVNGDGYITVVALNDTQSMPHTVGIYTAEENGETAIVLKDRDGNDMPFEGVGSIKVHTADGGEEIFINSDAVEKNVELNFAEGDMEITPEEGQLFSKVNIPQPANLKPAYIVKDVEIAGIVGTKEISGGDTHAGALSKAINFYDVEGNILYSYTRAEAALLTELPKVPTLGTLEGYWSHTLEQVQAAQAFLDVGATYKKNGNLAVVAVVEPPKGAPSCTFNFYASAASVTIKMYTAADTDTVHTTKTSTSAGKMVFTCSFATSTLPDKRYIVFEVIPNGSTVYLGGYSSKLPFFGASNSKSGVTAGSHGLLSVVCSCIANDGQSSLLKADRYSFYYDFRLKHICCYNLNSYSGSSSQPANSPAHCRALRSIVTNSLELSSTSIVGTYSFSACYALERVVLGIANIADTSTVTGCGNLRSVILCSVNSVQFKAEAPQELIITKTSTPGTITLGTNAAATLRAIYVPDEMVETYQTKWSTYAAIIKPLSEYPDY